MAGVGELSSDWVSLGELLRMDEVISHLACGCLPALTHCGVYLNNIEGIMLLLPGEKICSPCLKVWNASGCGRCSCRPAAICAACIQSAADAP